MGKWAVLLVATFLGLSDPFIAKATEPLSKSHENFLRSECQNKLTGKITTFERSEQLTSLLYFLEARTRGMVPPYDAQRCADWGYPPLDLPDVPEGWEDSPFTELIGELHMTEEYEQDLKDECRGIFPPRSISHLSLADQEKVMQGILEWRAAGVIARYSLKRCLDWGILPPGEKTDL